MILTFGNIKKSKILKYIFLDIPDERIFDERYKIFEGLHDATIKIQEENKNVVFDFLENLNRKLIFKNAKIVSKNLVKKNGHIARLNKNITPTAYGYKELYEHFGHKYATFALFL